MHTLLTLAWTNDQSYNSDLYSRLLCEDQDQDQDRVSGIPDQGSDFIRPNPKLKCPLPTQSEFC